MTLALIGSLVVLALVDSTSFGTLGVPVFILLAAERRIVSRILLYLVTIAAFYFAIGVGLMLGLTAVLNRFGDSLESRPAYAAQLAVGVGLVLLSYRFDPKWRAKRGLPEKRFEPQIGGPRVMVGLALTAGVVEVATMVPYLAAIGLMTASDLHSGQWVPLLAGYVGVMVLPALVLLGLRLVAGGWLEPKLERVRNWLGKNTATAVSWTIGIVGVLLALNALGGLFSAG